MNDIDRRNFLMMSSAGAAALGLGGGAAGAGETNEKLSSVVRFHGDGLGLTPGEYAACLGQLAAEDKDWKELDREAKRAKIDATANESLKTVLNEAEKAKELYDNSYG